MNAVLELVVRLLVAAVFGALIGYERELRAKGAGIRTHVLVAIGSSLFMLISQFGFPDAAKFDAARIAAGVVGGLGFLGGGIIMKTKSHVSGLTTAAGIWVTGAIGLACGSGMYEVAVACEVVVLICLELLNYYTVRLGEKEFTVVLSSSSQRALTEVVTSFKKKVKTFSLSKQDNKYKAEMLLHFPKRKTTVSILEQLNSYPDVELESFE